MELATAATCCELQKRLSFGVPSIDNLLRGGLLCGCLTEIYGESAVGKTQICLQLALMAQLPQSLGGLNGNVAYICTEDRFPANRMHEMSAAFQGRHILDDSPLDRIFVSEAFDMDAQESIFGSELEILLAERNVKLVVIDSIAGNFRYGESAGNESHLEENPVQGISSSHKAIQLYEIGMRLRKLAVTWNCAILLVNQVTGVIDSDISSCASLGNTWAKMLHTRLQITRNSSYPDERIMSVDFSPHLSTGRAAFMISGNGVC
eukprot:Partr_v1_DN27872_c1_g1_i1_m22864 putative X-ray repair complementing defective repair in Chinese hamster cells 3